MTRVVTAAAVLGVVQGVLVVLLLGPLGLSGLTGGWFSYSGSYSSSVVFTTAPRLSPRLGVPLVLAFTTAAAAAVAQRSGWLGPRPRGGAVTAGRVGVTAVVIAVTGLVLSPLYPTTVAFGPARSGSDRAYADYTQAGNSSVTWTVIGVSAATAVVLTVMTALREERAWSRRTVLVMVLVGITGLAAQLVLLDGLALITLAGDTVALILGLMALVMTRETPTAAMGRGSP